MSPTATATAPECHPLLLLLPLGVTYCYCSLQSVPAGQVQLTRPFTCLVLQVRMQAKDNPHKSALAVVGRVLQEGGLLRLWKGSMPGGRVGWPAGGRVGRQAGGCGQGGRCGRSGCTNKTSTSY